MRLREKRPEVRRGARVDAKAWREDTPGDWETFEVKANLFGNEKTPRGQTVDAGLVVVTRRKERSLANGRNRRGMRAVHRCGICVGRGHREVIQAAFNGIRRAHCRICRAVGQADRLDERAVGHALCLVGPFGFTGRDGNIAESVTGHTTGRTTRGTRVRAMLGRITRSNANMVLAATERIATHIRVHSRGECSRGGHAALHVRVLRVGHGAVRHDVRAVFLNRAEHAPGRTARSGRTARAGRTTATGFTGARTRTARTAGLAGVAIAATESKGRRGGRQKAYEKNFRFGHHVSISR